MNNLVSIYHAGNFSSPDEKLDIFEIYKNIKSGKYKAETSILIDKYGGQLENNFMDGHKNKYQDEKKRLFTSACFAGSFCRANEQEDTIIIENLSGRINFDLDKNQKDILDRFKQEVVSTLPFVEACGLSVSGTVTGHLWLNAKVEYPEEYDLLPDKIKSKISKDKWITQLYQHYADCISKIFNEHDIVPSSAKDIKRLRYLSDDPDLYLNESCESLTLEELSEYVNDNDPEKNKYLQNGKAINSSVIPEGERNTALTKAAGKLLNKGHTDSVIEEKLLEYNELSCEPPLPKEEVLRIAQWIITKERPDQEKDEHYIGYVSPDEAMEIFDSIFSLVLSGGKPFAIDEDERMFDYSSGKTAYRNILVPVQTPDGKEKAKNAFDYWWSHTQNRFDKIVFSPGENIKVREFNLWKGFKYESDESGNCSLFLDHIYNNICQEDNSHYNFLLDWMAQFVQKPEKKLGIVVALRGPQGVGKTFFGEIMAELIHEKHFLRVESLDRITGRFNDHLASKLLILADEAIWGGDKKNESKLKSLITASTISVEPKGLKTFTVNNYMRFIMTSNEHWMAPISDDDRRYFVLDVGERNKNDREYFHSIVEQMSTEKGFQKLMHILTTRDISKLNWKDIPITQAKLENVISGFDPTNRWLYESLAQEMGSSDYLFDGNYHESRTTKVENIFSKYIAFCDNQNIRYPDSISQFGKKIKDLLGVEKKRLGSGADRENYYKIPDLEECRKNFLAKTGVEFEGLECCDAD
jgi:hypothetical protein